MNTTNNKRTANLKPLTYAWLALAILTGLSVGLGQWFHGAPWLPFLVAAIVWIKGTLVARQFIESKLTHPFIARVLTAFIAFTPIALILTALFGSQFAQWATL